MLDTQTVASIEARSILEQHAVRIAPLIVALRDNDIDILEMKAAGDSNEAIAKHTGLSKASISKIFSRLCSQLELPHDSCLAIIKMARPLIIAQEDLKAAAAKAARLAKAEHELQKK
jgi:DNA-binding NarL/FixJ family response regulator